MIFDSLFTARSDPMENPSNPLSGDFGDYINASSGLYVNENNALKLSAVYSCIYILSSSLAQLPLGVLRKTGKNIEQATDHAAYYLLHDAPNPWQSSYDWRETGAMHATGWGNGFTRINRYKRGELKELVLSKPWYTSLVKNGQRYLYSTYDEDEGQLAVDPADMIHIRAIGSDGRMGKSPIKQQAEVIGLGLAAQQYGSGFFKSGGKPTAIVGPKGAQNKETWSLFKEAWKAAKAALRSSDDRTLLLPSELTYNSLTIPPEEAQFIETRKLSRSEIAGIFNVPAHMINDLEKATFSNISEQAIQFVRHTMMPWVVKWEQEINRKLFTTVERKAGYYVKFNLAGLLRGTAKDRAEFYHYGITDGWIDRNEVRALEDMNPRDGLDEMLVTVNALPASQVGKKKEGDDGN